MYPIIFAFMKEVFFKNILLLLLVNIIVKPFWIFGIDLQVQNTLGEAVYGHYFALLNFSLIYQIILDLGLQTYNTQRLAQHANRIHWLFPNIMMAKSLLALLYFGLMILSAWVLGFQGHSLFLLAILGIAQTANSFLLYFRSCIVSLHKYALESLLSILDKALMIILGACLLYTNWFATFKIEDFIYIQLLAYSISALIALYLLKKSVAFKLFNFNFNKTIQIIQKGIPYAILVFVMSLYFRGDSIILERLNLHTDPIQAGKYAAVYRLLDAANNFSGVLIAGMIIPMFAKHLRDSISSSNILHAAMQLLLAISIVAFIAVFFFGESIMDYLYQGYENGDGQLLWILFISFPFFCLNYVYSSYLTAIGDIKHMIVIVSIVALISILGNLILSGRYGAIATAIVCIISHSTASLLFMLRTYKFIPFKVEGKAVFKFTIYACILTCIAYILTSANISIIMSISILGVSSIIALLILKLIPLTLFKKNIQS